MCTSVNGHLCTFTLVHLHRTYGAMRLFISIVVLDYFIFKASITILILSIIYLVIITLVFLNVIMLPTIVLKFLYPSSYYLKEVYSLFSVSAPFNVQHSKGIDYRMRVLVLTITYLCCTLKGRKRLPISK